MGSGLVGATLLFSLGIGIAQAQVAPSLAVSLAAAPSVPAGSSQVALANITLDATHSSQNIMLSSIPLALSFNGVPAADFTNCSLEYSSLLGFPLNSGANAVAALSGTGVTFHTNGPLTVYAGTSARLAVVCNVSAAAPPGSYMTFLIDPSSIPATSASGASVTPTSILPIAGATSITAVSGGSGSTGGTVTTPGIPNTGLGGDALATLLILALSLLTAYIGATVSRKMQVKKNA